MLQGAANAAGTARYRERFPPLREAGHFRPARLPAAGELWLPSIGLGTYLGEPTDEADQAYTQAIVQALRSGINLLDAAINYRHQRSERTIGAALDQLISAGELQRDEVVVCTKAGYLAFDGNVALDPRRYFMEEYVARGVLDPAEIAGGMHCMAPAYLADQLERSRRNLRLETVDVFYLHNPESQLGDVERDLFRQRLRVAFGALERLAREGRICYYGIATWNALRSAPDSRDAVPLSEALGFAREAGGEQHHFRFLQLPFNLAMPEAWALKNHDWEGEPVSTVEFAARAGMTVVGSASLYQGRLEGHLPDSVGQAMGFGSDLENALQFARSAPGLTTALVGMGRTEHVDANLRVARQAPATLEAWSSLSRQP